MFNQISGLIANNKALRIVALAIPNGIRAYDHFKLVADADPANRVKVLPGVYVHGSYIIQLPAEVVLEGFTTPVAPRTDVVYLDVTSDTDNPVISYLEGQADPPANDGVHTYFPIWRIARAAGVDTIDNTTALGYPGGVTTDPENPSPYDRREIPTEFAPHNHELLQGATDVSATFQDLNHLTGLQAADPLGAGQKVTPLRLLDLCGSNATGESLNILVGGATTALHKHDASVQGIELPNGDIINPSVGKVIFTLDGWDQVTLAKTGGNKMTLFIPIGIKNPMDTNLDAAARRIMNLPVPTDDPEFAGDAVPKGHLDTLLALHVKYAGATSDINMANHQVKALAAGTDPADAVTVAQLTAAIAGVIGGSLAALDARYKLGGTDPSNINGNNTGKEAAGPVNMNTFRVHKLGDPEADEDAVNLRTMLGALSMLQSTLTGLINSFFPHDMTNAHTVTQDLDFQGRRIFNAGGPAGDTDLVTKAWVEARIAQLMPAPFEGDNLGNHTCIQALNFNSHRGVNLSDPGDEGDAVNKRYADAIYTSLTATIGHLAKLGDFATRANSERLPISTRLGGSLDIRGKTDQTLFYVGPDAQGNDVILAGTRIEQVGTPIKPADAVNKAYVDGVAISGENVWKPVPLAAGLTSGGSINSAFPDGTLGPAMYRVFNGNIEFKGSIFGTATIAPYNTTFGTRIVGQMPVGARPPFTRIVSLFCFPHASKGWPVDVRLWLHPDGVLAYSSNSYTGYPQAVSPLWLDGVFMSLT